MSPRPLTANSATPDVIIATAAAVAVEVVAEGVVVAVVDEAHAEAAGDGESSAGRQKVLPEHPFKAHAKAIRAVEVAPVGADTEAFVAGQVRARHGNRQGDAGPNPVGLVSDVVQFVEELAVVRRQVAVLVRGDHLQRATLPGLAQTRGNTRRGVGFILGAEHHLVVLRCHSVSTKSRAVIRGNRSIGTDGGVIIAKTIASTVTDGHVIAPGDAVTRFVAHHHVALGAGREAVTGVVTDHGIVLNKLTSAVAGLISDDQVVVVLIAVEVGRIAADDGVAAQSGGAVVAEVVVVAQRIVANHHVVDDLSGPITAQLAWVDDAIIIEIGPCNVVAVVAGRAVADEGVMN